MLLLELKPNNPAIHKSINPSSCGMTLNAFSLYFVIGHSVFDIGYSSLKLIAMVYTPLGLNAEFNTKMSTTFEAYRIFLI